MSDYLKEFNPPQKTLMGPGPSNVHPRVLRAMTAPHPGIHGPGFLSVMDDVVDAADSVPALQRADLPISGTGTAAMEAALCNMIEPGIRW